MIAITAYTIPVAQPRQRTRIIAGHAHNYTPADHPVQQFKADLKAAAIAAGAPPSPWTLPVVLEVAVYLPRPKRYCRKKDPDGPLVHAGRPDAENVLKAIQDAMKGILWADDALICRVTVWKLYAEREGRPRVEIKAWRLLEAMQVDLAEWRQPFRASAKGEGA